jgi:hypothetical protein
VFIAINLFLKTWKLCSCLFGYFSLLLSECNISSTLFLIPDILSSAWFNLLVTISTAVSLTFLSGFHFQQFCYGFVLFWNLSFFAEFLIHVIHKFASILFELTDDSQNLEFWIIFLAFQPYLSLYLVIEELLGFREVIVPCSFHIYCDLCCNLYICWDG